MHGKCNGITYLLLYLHSFLLVYEDVDATIPASPTDVKQNPAYSTTFEVKENPAYITTTMFTLTATKTDIV